MPRSGQQAQDSNSSRAPSLCIRHLLSFASKMRRTAGSVLVTDLFGPSSDNLEFEIMNVALEAGRRMAVGFE